MKVKVSEEFNIFELFVHENEVIGGVDATTLACAINEELVDSGWRVRAPEGLDRFTLQDADGEESFTERCYSIDQVRDYLPPDAVQALEEIDDMELDLSSKSINS